jgi:ABC-type polysaccharide/polyol phosphate export permease
MLGVARWRADYASWDRPKPDRDAKRRYEALIADLIASGSLAELWLTLGWHDIRQRYRRSVIGPFWITLATLIFVGLMTFLYSTLFNESFVSFLPSAAAGLVTWGLISACLTDGTRVFIDQSAAIKQLPLPLPVHVLRMLWQQFIIMLHNGAAIVLVLAVTRQAPSLNTILVVPGMALILVNLCWMAMLLGIIAARYRDVPIIVSSLMPVVFLVTPIFWKPNMLPAGRAWVVSLNPVANLLEVVRAPILGIAPNLSVWLACMALAIAGWAMTAALYGQCRNRIALWV